MLVCVYGWVGGWYVGAHVCRCSCVWVLMCVGAHVCGCSCEWVVWLVERCAVNGMVTPPCRFWGSTLGNVRCSSMQCFVMACHLLMPTTPAGKLVISGLHKIYACTHTCTLSCTHICAHTCTHTHAHMHIHMHAHMCTHTLTCTHLCTGSLRN